MRQRASGVLSLLPKPGLALAHRLSATVYEGKQPISATVQVSRDKDGIRIVTVRASSAEQQQKRVREAMDLMAVDLGDLALPQDFCAFLAIGPDARLHGCAIAHPIHVAYHAEFAAACQTDESGCSTDRIRPASAKSNTHAKQSASLRRGEKASPAACGISHIWVASQYRRRGVGMLLLEAVRRHMASSFELERRQMAFCQPTDAGCALALAYIGEGLPLLVYDGSEFTMDNREASSQPTDGNSVR